MTTSEQIKAIRASTGLTQKEFEKAFGIPSRTYEAWEMGERKPPQYVIRLLEMASEKLKKVEENA
nr:MAG TPA: putative transcriptional regulator [Caudoviricetes sp.]